MVGAWLPPATLRPRLLVQAWPMVAAGGCAHFNSSYSSALASGWVPLQTEV